jgi:hypothetical protein
MRSFRLQKVSGNDDVTREGLVAVLIVLLAVAALLYVGFGLGAVEHLTDLLYDARAGADQQ